MTIESVENAVRWYVVHTNPKQEERAYENLRAWGVDALSPKLRARRYNEFSGAVSYLSQPLFPRYIFARFNARKLLSKVRFTRGVHKVLSFGDGPVPVDEGVIEIIHSRIDERGFVKGNDDLKPGDKVLIKAGPLRNFVGVFEGQVKNSKRISLLLTTISYQGHLVVNRDAVERLAVTA